MADEDAVHIPKAGVREDSMLEDPAGSDPNNNEIKAESNMADENGNPENDVTPTEGTQDDVTTSQQNPANEQTVNRDENDNSISPTQMVDDYVSIVTDSERARSVLDAVEQANKDSPAEKSSPNGAHYPAPDVSASPVFPPIPQTANGTTSERDTKTPTKAVSIAEYTPRKAELGRIPSPSSAEKQARERQLKSRMSSKSKLPNGMVRLATVTMSNRGRAAIRKHHSHFVDHANAKKKVVSLDEAMNARPPLRTDMEGPTPCTYTPRNKPLRETNAPEWSFGRKSFVERDGGSRTSWEKTWFQTPHVYQQKTDFTNDKWWPSPTHYQHRHHSVQLGQRQHTLPDAPSFSIGVRRLTDVGVKKGAETDPAPGNYEKQSAIRTTLPTAPAFSHGQRRGGTVIWSTGEMTPGPGSYNPVYQPVQTHRPAFTIQGVRRAKSHFYGPFSTF